MFHHNIISLDEYKTIKKTYKKQNADPTKGDWFPLSQQDFKLFGETRNEQEVQETPMHIYRKNVTDQITWEAYFYFLEEKGKPSKLNEVTYYQIVIQHYLLSKEFNINERKNYI